MRQDKYSLAAAVTEVLRPMLRKPSDKQLEDLQTALVDLVAHMVEEHTMDYEHTSRDRY